MKYIKVLALVILTLSFTNCTIKERIVFNEDGGGNFLVSYDMGEFMKQMKTQMGAGASEGDEAGKVMDTTIVFKDLMESYKDSIAALPEEKKLALEVVKDMYMEMTMDEDKGVFDFGIGLDFKTIGELTNIGEKIQKAKSLNAKSDQVDAMKGSPLGKFMDYEKSNTAYDLTDTGFTRNTTLPEDWNPDEAAFDEADETESELMSYFSNAYYVVEYTFPKMISGFSVENAELSNNDKTITYKVSWLDFLKDPKLLDVDITFANE
ncbi:hypothetical protein [Seonamhaeicola sp. ML3]|uniref:hypothetical protein n=1 Tax=Seonamhaeicola sp. ML3 TaxID=2937786 RepID=UPI002010421C|nr:hypothetical protein [Seonamhaeicola sp. ML3]